MAPDAVFDASDQGRVVNRRRQWSVEVKQRIVAESYAGDASIAAVAMRHGVSPGLLFNWRRQMGASGLGLLAPQSEPPPLLTPIEVTVNNAPIQRTRNGGLIEIELAGARVRVDASVCGAALTRVFSALRASL